MFSVSMGHDVPIQISEHAASRAFDRFGLTRDDIGNYVEAAFRAGRVSGVRPAWLHRTWNRHSSYAWTEDERLVFAVGGGDDAWHVYTVMEGRR